MEFENKVLSKEILALLYESGKSIGTAESCTSGAIASAITLVPGASNYFKGGIVSYADEVKINLLSVDADIIEAETAVCEEVAKQMVLGTIKALGVDYAVSATGYAGPSGGPSNIPVGTIWLACGNADEQITLKLTEDNGRDKNISDAVHQSLNMFLGFLRDHEPSTIGDEVVELTAK